MPERIRILSPVPSSALERKKIAPPLSSLRGRVLGFRIEWTNFELLINHIEKQLIRTGEVGMTKRWDLIMDKRVLGRASDLDKARRQRELEEFASGLDAAVVGLAS